MKKFIEKIKNGIKKLFELITNKWLLKGTTTVALVAIVIACYIGLNWAVEKLTIEDLDFTTKKLYSLSDETKKRLIELDENITIEKNEGRKIVKEAGGDEERGGEGKESRKRKGMKNGEEKERKR